MGARVFSDFSRFMEIGGDFEDMSGTGRKKRKRGGDGEILGLIGGWLPPVANFVGRRWAATAGLAER